MLLNSTVSATESLTALIELARGRRLVVLSGAGCSTESGIPDYQGPDGRMRVRQPIQYGEFVRSEPVRARYWARSAVGWRRVSGARPNEAHQAIARLERAGIVRGVITQNVDGLHEAAGARRVLELHGSLAHVVCLTCGERARRDAFQARLLELNADRMDRLAAEQGGAEQGDDAVARPDGDAELPDSALAGFRVPGCAACGGVIKPDVVFFGESVPKARVAAAWALFEEAEVLLVAGSSLSVFSGRRFTDRAARECRPIAVINLGRTRADEVATVKVEARLGAVLPRLATALLEH